MSVILYSKVNFRLRRSQNLLGQNIGMTQNCVRQSGISGNVRKGDSRLNLSNEIQNLRGDKQ